MIEGKELENRRGAKIDCKDTIQEYIDKSDWRIQANANSNYSFSGLVSQTSGKIIANYWLNEVYSKKEGDAHRNGDYHIHDLDCLTPYCFTEDTKIKTVDFGNITIKELLEKNVSTFTVVSFDGEKMVECNAHDLRCTRKEAELVEVEFEDGVIVRCTPDHKFLALTPETDPETHEAYLKIEWKPAAYLTMRTVRKAYTCPIIKSDVIKLEEVEGVITESDAKNSFAKVISVKHLDYKEDVYCMTVDNTHCFALENGVIAHNCCGHDLQTLLQEGFNGVVSRVSSKPPKHLREALGQMANFIGILQSEWAGAQAFSSFDTLLAPYVFFDMMVEGITERDVKKALLSFVYNLNVPSRWGQAPFSNVTIDMTVPQTMRFLSPQRGNEPYFVRNWREFLEAENLTDDPDEALEKNEGWNRLIEEARARIGDYDSDEETILYSLTYQHFAPEMMIINKAYYEILSEGDCTGQPFTFPIPTVNITEDFDWDNPEYDFLFENAARYGSSYFQNFIGSQYLRDENGNLTIRDENAYSPNDLRSMCCRLQLSKKALRKRGGGLFGSDAQTGSIGVVTINMARLGYLYKGDIKGLYKRLTVLMDMARSTLDKKRAFVEEMYLRGLYPYTRRYVKTYDTYFSTIGVNGMNEMVRNFTNDEYDITDERGQKMCMEILDYMNKKMEAYQEDGKALWNLEATPAEGTTTRFAREDIKRYPDIIQAGFPDAPYYTNSSQLPVDFSSDVFSTLDLQDELQKKYTGGCVEAGNYVITDRGRILIDELCNNSDKYKGIRVISYNTSTNSSEWDLVTDFHKIDVSQKDKIHVVGNGGLDIVTSDWHPFFVVTDDGTVIEKRADELKKNDYVLCNSTVMFDDSDKELTPELAYVIGFYIGDGSMSLTHDNRGCNNIPKHNVRFHHSNEDRIRRLEKILIDNKLCFAKARKCDKRSKNLMCIGTTKKSMYEFLNKYGFTDGEKSKTVHFSDTLKSQLNKKNAFALLSGLFDTDAHVDPITDDMEYFTASEELAKDIVYLCSMLGIKCSYSIKNDKRYDHSHYRLYIPAKSLYEVEDELMSFRKPTGVSKDKVSHKSIIKNNYNVVRVTDVSKCDVDDNVFYDLTTEKNHNYLCGKRNYVFIHNTVLHIYNDEDVTSEECKLLLKKVLTNYRLPYVSFTATFSSCPKHGRISGIHEYCPLCDKELMQKHLSEIDLNKA